MPSISENKFSIAHHQQPRPQQSSSSSSSSPQKKLRIAKPHEMDFLCRTDDNNDDDDDETGSEYGPQDIDEPWRYSFRSGDAVWVRATGGEWYTGVVSGQTKVGQTRQKEGLFYPVIYGDKFRKYFAPLNGEIKPDTPRTRQLLDEGGYV